MNAETIQDFLVSLGFQVDQSGQRKFEQTLVSVAANTVKMATAVEASALTVVAFTAKIASGLDNLYWSSQRAGASVSGIQAIGYAASQMGGTVEGARGSLESLARFMRNNPGAEGFLNRLGVQTRDASGNMRDMSAIFTGVGQRLSNMPYYRANQFAQMLGIDENTLMAMRRGLGTFSTQYTQMAKAIGYNADTAARQSNQFMTSLRSFGLMAGMARDKLGSDLASGLNGNLNTFKNTIINNFPKIERVITSLAMGVVGFGNVIFRLGARLVEIGSDVIDWFNGLSIGGKQLVETLGLIAVAWRALNFAFALTPIGMIVTGIAAIASGILLLYDDYKTWKEGGKSLIDWDKWKPYIDSAKDGIAKLGAVFVDNFGKMKGLGSSLISRLSELSTWFGHLLNIDFTKFSGKAFFDTLIDAAVHASKVVGNLIDAMNHLVKGEFGEALNSLKDAGANVVIAAKETPVGQAILGTGGFEGAGGLAKKLSSAGAAVLNKLQPVFDSLESQYSLPQGLLRGVATTESSGNPNAQSKAGAQGLFQIMPGTASDLGLRGNDVFDPIKAAQAAAKYLSQLMRANGGDLSKTLASYNWGLGNVQRKGMDGIPRETQNYIPRVLSNMEPMIDNIRANGSRIIPDTTRSYVTNQSHSSTSTTLNQETVIHIHDVNNPREAGNVIAERQSQVNSRAAQQLSGRNS